MSYYSDVSIAMKKEDYLELLCNADCELTSLLEERTAYKKESKDGDVIVLAWENINWNKISNYIFTYLDELDKNDKPYKMVRTGEIYEDIEVWENYHEGECDVIYPIKMIGCDFE